MFTILDIFKYYTQTNHLLTQSQPEQPKRTEVQLDPETRNLFSQVQGDILRGFNKPEFRLIFFNIGDNSNIENARTFFRGLSKRIPNTLELIKAAQDLKDKRDKDPNFIPSETFLHVSF